MYQKKASKTNVKITSKTLAILMHKRRVELDMKTKKDEPKLVSTIPQLSFNLSRHETALLFFLLRKAEFLDTGRNELSDFLALLVNYKGDDGKYYRLSTFNSLWSQFANLKIDIEPVREHLIKKLEMSLRNLNLMIDTLKNEPIESE